MDQRISETPALGVPGQTDGRATLPSDRGDETQALFTYQWAAGVVILAAAFSSQNRYAALWCEHHDDFLAEQLDGGFHVIQVKTTSTQGATWTCSSPGFVDAIRKFAEHESKFSAEIQQYIFFSNAKPYVPAATAKKPGTLANSPVRLREECRAASNERRIPTPYKDSFDGLVEATDVPSATIFKVMRKLEFQIGPPLEGFREHLTVVIGGIPACKQFTLGRIEKVRDELMELVRKASTLDVPSLDLYTSVIQADGRPAAIARSKRLSVEDFSIVLNQMPSTGFLYAEVGGYLQLGRASGQKEILRKKMNDGYVGAYFDSVWLQAMAAEQKLLERVYEDPIAAMRVNVQLTSVMLVECQNAEAEASLEDDERRRGKLIYQQILKRTGELAQHDKVTVENERPETLRGIAGLLSGSCKFAWGIPLDEGGSDGS